MATKRINQLTQTATEADLVVGNHLVVDTPDGTKRLPAEAVAKAVDVMYESAKADAYAIGHTKSRANNRYNILNVNLFANETYCFEVSASEAVGAQINVLISKTFDTGTIRTLVVPADWDGSKYVLKFKPTEEVVGAFVSAYFYRGSASDVVFKCKVYNNNMSEVYGNISSISEKVDKNTSLIDAINNEVNGNYEDCQIVNSSANSVQNTFAYFSNSTQLVAGKKYRIRVSADEPITSTQVEFYLAKNTTTPIYHFRMCSGSWDGSVIEHEWECTESQTAIVVAWCSAGTTLGVKMNCEVFNLTDYDKGVNQSIADIETALAVGDKAVRPSTGLEFFNYQVDVSRADIEDGLRTTTLQETPIFSTDYSLIKLPVTYKSKGEKTPLVLLNHGAGGWVSTSYAEDGNSTFVSLLLKEGYAVLFVNGLPDAMRSDKYMPTQASTHMGSEVFLRCIKKAYDYVVNKYNVDDEVFVIGRSMGGLGSLNIAMNGILPVKVLALDAPVIDLYKDAYFSGGWFSGPIGAGTYGMIAWMYNFDGCDFDAATYTIDGVTKNLADLKNNVEDCEKLWEMNRNKTCNYNPYKAGDYLVANIDGSYVDSHTTDNDPNYFGKKISVPCKIWFGSSDPTNQIEIARRFVEKIRNGGGFIQMRTLPTSTHTIWTETTTSEGVDISTTYDGVYCSKMAVELLNWLNKWK